MSRNVIDLTEECPILDSRVSGGAREKPQILPGRSQRWVACPTATIHQVLYHPDSPVSLNHELISIDSDTEIADIATTTTPQSQPRIHGRGHRGMKRSIDSEPEDPVALPLAPFTHEFWMEAVQGNEMIAIEDKYKVTYTSDLTTLKAWCSRLPDHGVLGFDTEGNGCIVQLCCLNTCEILIFRMPSLTESERGSPCISVLSSLLGQERYIKVGIGAFNDAIILSTRYHVRIANIVDLGYLANDLELDSRGDLRRIFSDAQKEGVCVIHDDTGYAVSLKKGLKTLFADLFTAKFIPLSSIHETCTYEDSNTLAFGKKWSRDPIPRESLQYAAKDALFGSLLYNAMLPKFSAEEIANIQKGAAHDLQVWMERRVLRSRARDADKRIWRSERKVRKQEWSRREAEKMKREGSSRVKKKQKSSSKKAKVKPNHGAVFVGRMHTIEKEQSLYNQETGRVKCTR